MARDALTLHIEPNAASRTAGTLVLTNNGDVEVRVWRTGNTWGDDAFWFEAPGAGPGLRIVRTPQVYTRNVPATVTLGPAEHYEVPFDLQDGSWEPEDAIRSLQSPSARLIAVYDSGRSAEARTQGVLPGQVRSEPR